MNIRQELPRPEKLTSHTNWASWKSTIEAHARHEGVWDYCNPDLPGGNCSRLKEPEKPHFSTIRPGATSIVDFGEADFAEVCAAVDDYWRQMSRYNEIQRKLLTIFDLIRSAVDPNHFFIIERADSPREQLMILADEFDEGPLKALEPEWELIQHLAQEPKVQELFGRWRALFSKCADEDAWGGHAFWNVLEKARQKDTRQPLDSQYWAHRKYRSGRSPSRVGSELSHLQLLDQAERDWHAIAARYCLGPFAPSKLKEPTPQNQSSPSDEELSDEPTEVWDGSEAPGDLLGDEDEVSI